MAMINDQKRPVIEKLLRLMTTQARGVNRLSLQEFRVSHRHNREPHVKGSRINLPSTAVRERERSGRAKMVRFLRDIVSGGN
jgi:hypothetical protein